MEFEIQTLSQVSSLQKAWFIEGMILSKFNLKI